MVGVMFGFGFGKKQLSKSSSITQTFTDAGCSPELETEMLIRLGLREGLPMPIEVISKGKYTTTASHATLKRFIVKGADNRK